MNTAAPAVDLVVTCSGLEKVYRDFWGRPKSRAVNGIDFDIRRGEIFGLLGPNGSGKSTTIKMLLGLVFPTRGSLKVLDGSPRDLAVKARIGYLPEETPLYKHLSAIETVEFFGSLFGLPQKECRTRAEQLVEMVGLGHVRNRPVGEFSKGMARRIGLAQALVNDPDFIILDEPTSGLDPLGCREVKDLVKTLAARGKTVLLTSHLLADVEDVVDRAAVMYGGRIRAAGSLESLLEQPGHRRLDLSGMSPEQSARLDAFLAAEGLANRSQPLRRDLEQLFLDVVSSARAEQLDSSGAQLAGKLASHLSGPGLLEQLSQAPAAPAPPETAMAPRDESAEKLEKILAPSVETPPPPAAPKVDDEAVNAKLNSLLGKRD
ncbi:MAG: hypothetical protein RL095_1516 [Verrucomicrobiota bacterium]|jgi:ABC-2 type transport system ATP-binding protein